MKRRSPQAVIVWSAAALVLFFDLALSRDSSAQGTARPRPPTNLTVTITPATGVVDRGFAREGISKAVRTVIFDSLAGLEANDLRALAQGFDPEQLGLAKPAQIGVDQWKRLVASYADAAITDRQSRSELARQVLLVVLSVLLTTAAAVPVGMWLERRKR